MLKYITLLATLLISSMVSAAEMGKSIRPLPSCGGRLEIERSDLQTVIAIKDVKRCPYVVFEEERQSMRLTPNGHYETVYVWPAGAKHQANLRLVVHTATGSVQDTFDIKGSAALTAQLEQPIRLPAASTSSL